MLHKILFSLFFLGITLNATTPTQKNITKLYIATFDRVPDAQGLAYWLNDSELDLESIAMSFFEQPETVEKYPEGFSNSDFIDSVYTNLFNRKPDSYGAKYWLMDLENENIQRDYFILAVINGAKDTDADILENKTNVGLAFIEDNRDDASEAKDILSNITQDITSVNEVLCQFELANCEDVDDVEDAISNINNDILAEAFNNQTSDIQVNDIGSVIRILSDDNDGSAHQRFILELSSGQTLLIAHNIDLAPKITSISIGDRIEFFGEYVWNSQGGLVHWTHKDPNQTHIDGWLKHNGITYQ